MTKEREAEIKKHHAPHDPHCNEHCTTRGLLELLDAEREKNAKLAEAGAKIVEAFERHLFVRNTQGDSDRAFAIRFAPYLLALAVFAP